jgi:hypothetical protein
MPSTFDPHSRQHRWAFLFVFTVGLLFAWFTQHAWEDYYITYRTSKNIALGNGAVFQPGERVHSFTSAFNTLVPALFSWLAGNRSDAFALWGYRVVSLLALGAGAWMLSRVAARCGLGTGARWAIPLLLVLEVKITDYSINGQEIGFMVFFIAAGLYVLLAYEGRKWMALGASWAGLMWTRPDGFVYGGAVAVGIFLFAVAETGHADRRALLGTLLKAALFGAVLYLPWVAWAAWYYGSPVPHTILAKGLNPTPEAAFSVRDFLKARLDGESFNLVFLPGYGPAFGGWPMVMRRFGTAIALCCAVYWVLPSASRLGRAASFAFGLANFYLSQVAAYPAPWYLPNASVLGIVVLGAMLHDLRRFPLAAGIAASALFGHFAFAFFAGAWQLRQQQAIVEDGNRTVIGQWLRDHALSANETVFLECLGYIGYFSQLKMLDYPGLSSPEVVAARRKLGTNEWSPLIRELRPNWLVLRPREEAELRRTDPALLEERYEKARVFDVSERVRALGAMPGRAYLECDETFTVFRRLESERP